MIREIINGICMALADSVPGVSGGTIAFIMGFYDKFIGSINDLFFERGEKRKEALIYLFKLGTGWAAGMIGAVLIITSAFEKNIYLVSSLFIGFILAALPLILKQEKESIKNRYGNIIFTIIGIVIVAVITKFNNNSMLEVNLNNFNILLAIYLFVAGMIAISAMFLPGISGSTLLLILGLYMPIMAGVREILHFNFKLLPSIVIFGLGVIIGALTVVKGIKICLEKFRSQTIYIVLGLMIGSLYAIAMGPSTLDVPKEPLSLSNFNYFLCIIGIAIVYVIERVGKKQEQEVLSQEEIIDEKII